VAVTRPGRLTELAREAGLSPVELRAVLAAEIDRVVRERVREATARDRALFNGDRRASRRQSGQPRDRRIEVPTACPEGHVYGPADFDRRGRRRCSRCRPGKKL
jgi:hypothetical protein